MLKFIFLALSISFIINLIGFLIAFRFKTDKLTDFSYSLSFMAVNSIILILAENLSLAKFILLSMISIWALRLGSYLVIRIREWGSDNRFNAMRNNFLRFFSFWMIQASTVWIVSLSSIQFFKLDLTPELGVFSIVGIIIFAKGLIIESIADFSLFKFSKLRQNKGKFIDSGLWSISRHPNYLGEITVWFGLWIYTLQSVSLTQAFIGMISPLFIFLMIRFVSGVPKLEAKAQQKWGQQNSYIKYKKQTDLIFPSIKFIKTRLQNKT